MLGDQHVEQPRRSDGKVGMPGDHGAGGFYLLGLKHALVEGELDHKIVGGSHVGDGGGRPFGAGRADVEFECAGLAI